MANQLKMDKVHAVLALRRLGWSYSRIARELGIHRTTVAACIKSKPTKVPAGSPTDGIDAADPGAETSVAGSSAPDSAVRGPDLPGTGDVQQPTEDQAVSDAACRSACQPFRELILAKVGSGLSAQRIYQDLVCEHAFPHAYDSVKRYVRKLTQTQELPFRRMECEPGREAQVDFGQAAPVVDASGKRRRPHVLRIVLSHSRKGYSEVVDRQTTENFIRCLENAFWHFGGVPQTLILDNLRAAVTKADWFDPVLNPKVESFAEHYGIAILPAKPYTPRHKGKVERGVDYVQENALKGKTFSSLEEQNRSLLEWETSVADTRIHGTTRKQVGRAFHESEKHALQRLPIDRFPFFHEGSRSVHRDGHVEVDKAYYSVPPEYLARRVWVRWDARMVRVFNQHMEQIALHAKQRSSGFSTQEAHIASEKINSVERGAKWLLDKVRLIGPQVSRWAEAMIEARGIQGVRVLQGLLDLSRRHPSESLEKACETALSFGGFRLKLLRQLLQRQEPRQVQLQLLSEHPIIRNLADYGELVHRSFQKQRDG